MDTQRLSMGNLAVMLAIASVIWTTAFAYAPQKAPKCCQKVSMSEVTYPIISYRLQIKNLPCVKAVILETQRGEFCINPRAPWVREKISQFKKAQKDKPILSGLSDIWLPHHHQHHHPPLVKSLMWEDLHKRTTADNDFINVSTYYEHIQYISNQLDVF